jgi:fumarylacetoacetate (FAA) hydrolase
MKLGTIRDNSRDGKLVVVSRDGQRYQEVGSVCPTMQNLLDSWDELSPKVEEIFNKLDSDSSAGEKVDVTKFHAPLPRAYEWIDGSAYINHIVLVRKARNAEPPETLKTDPLVYQGGSGCMLGPVEDIPYIDGAYGLDFESEVVVYMGDTPMQLKGNEAEKYIRLVGICNDVSLRGLIPSELQKGFGFFTSKPASAFAPFVVTPDELGDSWKEGRVHLNLNTDYNGEFFGNPNAGPEMFFSFHDILNHITKTREYTAGTIVGSGTVSNEDRARGSSCLAEVRMIEKIDTGEFKTPFMKPGDTVKIEMLDNDGNNIFGTISQKVVQV